MTTRACGRCTGPRERFTLKTFSDTLCRACAEYTAGTAWNGPYPYAVTDIRPRAELAAVMSYALKRYAARQVQRIDQVQLDQLTREVLELQAWSKKMRRNRKRRARR